MQRLLLYLTTLSLLLAQTPLPPCSLHLSKLCNETANIYGPFACFENDDCQVNRFCNGSGLCDDDLSANNTNNIQNSPLRILQAKKPTPGSVYGTYGVANDTTTPAAPSDNSITPAGEVFIILGSVFAFIILFVVIIYCGRKERKKKVDSEQQVQSVISPKFGGEDIEITYGKIPFNNTIATNMNETESGFDTTPYSMNTTMGNGFSGVQTDYSRPQYNFADSSKPQYNFAGNHHGNSVLANNPSYGLSEEPEVYVNRNKEYY